MTGVSRDPVWGDLVVDTEQQADEQDAAIVVNTPSVLANEWEAYVDRDGNGVTVAEDNPSYPEESPLAVVVFKEELEKVRPNYYGDKPLSLSDLASEGAGLYAFPVERLQIVGSMKPPEIGLSEVSPSPYSVREFDQEDKSGFIEDVQEQGHVGSYPLVRPVEDGYQTVEGHTRIWAARQAGLDNHRIRVEDLSDWEAANRFVYDHIPPREQNEETPEWKYYDTHETQEVLKMLYADFGNQIFDIGRIEHHAEQVTETQAAEGGI